MTDAFVVKSLNRSGMVGDGLIDGVCPDGKLAVVVRRAEGEGVVEVVDEVSIGNPNDDQGIAGVRRTSEGVGIVGEVLAGVSKVRPVVAVSEGESLPLTQNFDPDTTIARTLAIVTREVIVGGGGSSVAKNVERAKACSSLVDTQSYEQRNTNCEPLQTFHVASLPLRPSK